MLEPRVQFAFNEKRDVVDVTQVARGAACRCTCMGCGEPLIARQGEIVMWHFSHTPGSTAVGCAETALHLAAKESLKRLYPILIPFASSEVKATDSVGRHYSKEAVRPAYTFQPNACELEARLGSKIIDAILTRSDGARLGIEIYVTHKVGGSKSRALTALKVPILEIDLREYIGAKLSLDDLQVIVSHLANREVLVNERMLDLSNEVQVKADLDARVDRINTAIKNTVTAIPSDVASRDAVLACTALTSPDWPSVFDWSGWLPLQSTYIMPRKLFNVHHSVWQAHCFLYLKRRPIGQKFRLLNILIHLNSELTRFEGDSCDSLAAKAVGRYMRFLERSELVQCLNDELYGASYGETWFASKALTPKQLAAVSLQVSEHTVFDPKADVNQVALF